MSCRICRKPVYRRDLCPSHYSRDQRYGSPTGSPGDLPPSDFAGFGVEKCRACGRPVVEHRIGRCLEMERA